MLVTVLILVISISLMPKTNANFQQTGLYRDQKRQIAIGNFTPSLHHKLSATIISSFLVADRFDCTFNCIIELMCNSFNIAANPDSDGFLLCELLDTDKYRAAEVDLQENGAFHHYSPWRSICQPGFAGIHCQRKGKTCSEIKYHSPKAISGSYVIDPDGEGGYEPFTVFCDMTDKNGVGVSVLGHDSEIRTLVNGYEDRGSYVRVVNYIGAGVSSVSQIAGLPDASAHCEQFIKYECLGSLLLFNGNPTGWWVSRDMAQMTYWGGATPADSYKCACGVTNTCVNTDRGCNCDANQDVWREDSGLLTEKSHLPVTQLKFGDTGKSSESGYHTLGKLKCYGMA